MTIPGNMRLRHVLNDDHEFLVDLHNDPEVLYNITHPLPITLQQHYAWWEQIVEDPKQLRLIFTVDGARVGFTKFYDIDTVNGNCVLGADIHRDHRGKGYAKYMWARMLDWSFFNLNLHRVSLTTATYNPIGMHVYTKIGFKREGMLIESLCRDGEYHDQVGMYMLRQDWVKP